MPHTHTHATASDIGIGPSDYGLVRNASLSFLNLSPACIGKRDFQPHNDSYQDFKGKDMCEIFALSDILALSSIPVLAVTFVRLDRIYVSRIELGAIMSSQLYA